MAPPAGSPRPCSSRGRLAAALVLALPLLAAGPVSAQPDALYARHCVTCHGAEGRGDGPAAGLLSPRPRDFTAGVYKFRSTPTGTLPTVEDLARTIRVGLPGTSMPGFEGLISSEDVEAPARRLLEWAPRAVPTAPSIVMGFSPAHSLVQVQRGRELYAALGCAGCHGGDGRVAAWRPEREGPGLPSPPADLTQPWSFRGGSDRAAIALRLATGLDGSPMPSYGRVLSRDQAFQLAMFVESLARRPIWEELDPDRVRRAGVATDPLARGRYLTNAMLCPLCHTPISPDTGAYLTERFMAGGTRVSAYPWGVWYSRNLTPDRDTGLGHWSEAEIVRALTEGVARDGRHLDALAMPWPWFSKLTRADAHAIAVYLKSLPPVANPVPAPEWGWPGEMVGGKLLAFFGVPAAVEFWGGNAAAEPALRGRIPAWWLHRLVSHLLGWASLGGVGWLGWQAWRRWKARRRPPLVHAASGGAALLVWLVIAAWPPLGLMGSTVTTTWLFMGRPALPSRLPNWDHAFAERGEYLSTVAPCGLCHTPARAFSGFVTRRWLAGGMEGRWRVYGSATSTNLTPHPDHGIGRLSDAALMRGLRAGIGGDGRAMHWQAMPWDIGSHWSEEDQRAMIYYFRKLALAPGKAPAPRAPRPRDPGADTFYFGDAIAR